MSSTELLLIDLSALAHQLFHVSGNEPDPNFISTKLIERVRGLASAHPHAAICCDSGKSFRHDLDPAYKANRDTENRGVIKHQADTACAVFKADGFPVWAVKGYEADDLIATATREALAMDPDIRVLIASADKDLLQLVNGRVSMKKTTDGNLMDSAAVVEKFGITPAQMLDYLCLVGDSSDNIKGAEGIGAVKAAALLKEFGTLAAVYEAMDAGDVKPRGVTPALRTSLQNFRDRWPLVKSLVALKDDAPISIAEIGVERTAQPQDEPPMSAEEVAEMLPSLPTKPMDSVVQQGEHVASGNGPAVPTPAQSGDVVGSIPTAVLQRYDAPPVADFSLQLEPRTPEEAARLAGHLFKSRLFSAYGTWEGILAVILSGRELGMGAMKSLKTHHIMDGRAVESADLIAGQVLSSGKAVYFRPVRRSDTAVTFKTLRAGDGEEPFELTYTIEEAKLAWKKDERAWNASGWGKNPADMLVARCKSKLARLVYPDVVAGLYSREEFE